MHIINKYDTNKYKFKELIEDCFSVNDISNLHIEKPELLPKDKLYFENESTTNFHNIFYKKLNSDWHEVVDAYENFIKNEINPLFKGDFVYQNFPSFRVQLPDEQAIHYWHYDSDKDHMHPEWEINFQIALTDMSENNCIWIESIPGLQDFKPMILKYGEYCIFDGNRCMHGNKINDTNKTRISFDFRVMPYNRYEDLIKNNNLKKSATAQKEFIVGKYYNLFKKG